MERASFGLVAFAFLLCSSRSSLCSPLCSASCVMSSNSAHNDLLVGAAFVGGFALAAYLVSRTGSGRSASSGAAGGAAAASLCGPILNPTFDGPIGVPLPEDGSSKWICRCGQSKKFPFCDGGESCLCVKCVVSDGDLEKERTMRTTSSTAPSLLPLRPTA